jgi:predicted transcriptional regulator
MTIRMIKDVLRLKHESQLSHARIAATLQISKGVVSKYVSLATTAELTWEELRELDEAAIAARLLPGSRSSAYVPPDYARIHQELRRKGVTLTAHAHLHRCLFEPVGNVVLVKGQGGRYSSTAPTLIAVQSTTQGAI